MYAFLIVAAVIILDQLIKLQIVSKIMPNGDMTVINNLFNLTYVENRGIAFGMFKNKTIFFIVCTIVIASIVLYYLFKFYNKHVWVGICLALILGGAIGNLIDRVRLGYVIDYLHFSFFPPVFNLADSAVVLGAFVLGLIILLDKNLTF